MITCVQCGRRTQIPLCRTCVGQLDAMLAELCWLLGELETTAARQDRLTLGQAHSFSHPLPANLSALDLERSITAQLARLAAEVAPVPRDTEARLLARWLRRQVPRIALLNTAHRHYRTISRLVGFSTPGPIHDLINRPDNKFAGPCPSCRVLCYARHEDVYTVCQGCGEPIDVERNRAATVRSYDLMTERILLDTLDNLGEHVPRVRFYGWVTAGQLPIAGYLSRAGIVSHRSARSPRVYSLDRARALRRRDRWRCENGSDQR